MISRNDCAVSSYAGNTDNQKTHATFIFTQSIQSEYWPFYALYLLVTVSSLNKISLCSILLTLSHVLCYEVLWIFIVAVAIHVTKIKPEDPSWFLELE